MTPREKVQNLADQFSAKGDPIGWFEALYSSADGDAGAIPWADLKPNPNLISWLDGNSPPKGRALTIGCGLGDDAEELARRGWKVSAFDVSASAIEWCRKRFANSQVDYRVADLLNPPGEWSRSFDFVFEAYTLQVLPEDFHHAAMHRMSRFLAPGGQLLIICRGREAGEVNRKYATPLLKEELAALAAAANLKQRKFEDFLDSEDPPVRRFRIVYEACGTGGKAII